MLLMIVIILLMFTVIVVAHEWGHYITAKKCGVLVHEFAVGMGPMVWSKQVGETLYSIRLLPIGGFCRMEEEVGKSKNPRAMASKKPWQKLIIVSAGAIMNFFLAWLLLAIFVGYRGSATNIIQEVQPGTPAMEAGLQANDRVLAINGHSISHLGEIQTYMTDEMNTYTLTVKRDGETLEVPASSGGQEVEHHGAQQRQCKFPLSVPLPGRQEQREILLRAAAVRQTKHKALGPRHRSSGGPQVAQPDCISGLGGLNIFFVETCFQDSQRTGIPA